MVSVIIPIYNVAGFIDKGLPFVLNQSYKDLEVILVNDGSTDNSLDICNKWASVDNRVRVISQPNQGAGGARNHGIELAKGDFIYFFDIDDQINRNLIEYCTETAIKYNVEMVVFGYSNIETTYNSSVEVSFDNRLIESNHQLRDVFVDEFILKTNGFPWNKFYRKNFLDQNNLRFENQRIQQDEVFNLKCYRYIKRMYISSQVLYSYYVYEKGNTRSRFIPDRFDIYKSVNQHFNDLLDFWDLHDSRFDSYLLTRFYNGVLQCMLFNNVHRNCTWPSVKVASEMHRIITDNLTIDAFNYADEHFSSIEHRAYRFACRKESIALIRLFTKLFNCVHSLRKKLL